MVDREPKESRVSVTVHIRDRNDNRPEFESTQYVIFVSESLPLGGNVTQVEITCIYIYVYMCVCAFCVCLCVCVCIYIYIYIYIHAIGFLLSLSKLAKSASALQVKLMHFKSNQN
jgi:hypothetical protein